MKTLLDVWTGYALFFSFDLWRYPDIVTRQRRERGSPD
jgi:hypothetical protein